MSGSYSNLLDRERLSPSLKLQPQTGLVEGACILHPGRVHVVTGGSIRGGGSYDIERSIASPGFSALAKGNTDIDNVDGGVRAANHFDFGGWYLKPLVDLDATRLNLDGTNEHGTGGAKATVNF